MTPNEASMIMNNVRNPLLFLIETIVEDVKLLVTDIRWPL